jgi:hypothetical protein
MPISFDFCTTETISTRRAERHRQSRRRKRMVVLAMICALIARKSWALVLISCRRRSRWRRGSAARCLRRRRCHAP